jgi:aminoglycoside phosphotransferase (APT) family kinase protein
MSWQERLTDYLRARLPHADGLRIERCHALGRGASNTTMALDVAFACGGREHRVPMIFRPQRAHGLLEPYDVGRQFRIMRALAGTTVPVPAVAFHESDPSLVGAPFFLMERVEGWTLPLFWYDPTSPELDACAKALALVHQVDWDAAGLAFLRRGSASPVGQELEAWNERAVCRGVAGAPLLVRLGAWLRTNEPDDTRMALLHGDPNPGNYILGDDRVMAVIDWELADLGDPRSDLGFYAALMAVFAGWYSDGGRTSLSDAYSRVTGRELLALEYFELLGLYKMAVIMAGWAGLRAASGPWYALSAVERRVASLLGAAWAA